MNLQEAKKAREDRLTNALESNGVFFAFSNEQYEKNKTPLKEGEKYLRLAGGGFIPKGNLDNFLNQLEASRLQFEADIKAHNLRESLISYELSNHECYYTGDIEPALAALGEGYTMEEVVKVYNETREEAAQW